MAFVKKTWKDRIAEFPTRRRLTKEDNTSELVTVAREEGTLSQEGDAFSAENMNDLENRIDAEFTEVNGNLNCFIGKKISLERACSAGQWVNKSVGTIPTKDGYSFIGCYVCTGNSVGVSVSYENDSNEVWIYGKTSGTAIVYCYPIYVKN